mmetsp:Transcript_4042/g.12047  ORF Transcript_4042/g.12047 Transcript_4042/m.12047 type:complete len:458 (+) Transcript_4042:254-1627(+)
MTSWQTTGSFRERARNSERATQQLGEQRRRHAAVRTQEALQKFEEHLVAEQEALLKDFDDLPAEAEGMMRSRAVAREDAFVHRTFSTADVPRAQSQPQLHPGFERDPTMKKPPSPLTFHDYGCVSIKPRSTFAQHRRRLGEPTRPKHRQSSCGFYFPGTELKQGPYGFSMVDPCLMPPRSWADCGAVPTRWSDERSDARPLESQALGLKRNRSAGPTTSPTVRTTAAHSQRAQRAFQVMDKHREEAVLEHARFENGVFEGRWRDPLLETKGQLPEPAPLECHDWLSMPEGELSDRQRLASRIVFGLFDAMRSFRGSLTALFAAESRGGPGVLEPAEFLHGLVRLGVLKQREVTLDRLVQAIPVIDQSSDGRVRLPAAARAVAVARAVRKKQQHATEQLHQQRQVFLSTKYSESLPVDVVKLDKEPKSLYNFERSMEKFRSQQRALLVQHNEHDAEPE